ncbi:putative flavo protein [Aspergillus campestris IBT 28561]|uniref:Flavo protein n=1 Tax=Aspergillus campestris (strain IBT 28561) TaxID=1392248 RepID=A0A2I1CSF5_ASPC2|nr:putative flavo protein [Aspergillus campestris IBT 28561]PKY00548.1 putative flavo protein [Aspergillus campestris IBT 28561]
MGSADHYDIVIIGAGIAGINAAYRVQTTLPHHSYVILEARPVPGGTWDLFRYPGVRADSDIHTYGFPWYPYPREETMPNGHALFEYINDAARVSSIDSHIIFNHRVMKSAWSSQDNMWTLETVAEHVEGRRFRSRFVIFATGYFDHQRPLSVEIPGLSTYRGTVVHPQFWPPDLEYSGKNVAVIGSGATAISLVPKLAETASAVTVIQRSPSYIVSVSSSSGNSTWLTRLLPTALSRKLKCYGWLAVTLAGCYICPRFPRLAKAFILKLVGQQLPDHIPIDPHFTPQYNVWDQRLLACPNGDFFQSLRGGRATIETAHIQAITDRDIVLDSGRVVNADIIVTATGLSLQIGGGTQFTVDGDPCDLSQKFMWKGVMLQDIPNAFFVLGYLTNASWTLGADISALLICRLIKRMENGGGNSLACTPRMRGSSGLPCRLWDLKSTYVVAADDSLPKAGGVSPWRPRSNYILDYFDARYGSFGEYMEFTEAV